MKIPFLHFLKPNFFLDTFYYSRRLGIRVTDDTTMKDKSSVSFHHQSSSAACMHQTSVGKFLSDIILIFL
jgi:hypothetical protein